MVLLGSRTFALLVGFLYSVSSCLAQNPRLSRDLSRNGVADIDVIVQYSVAPTAAHHKKITDRGGKLNADLGFIRGGAYTIHAADLDQLARDPEVAYISPDRPVSSVASPPQ